MVRRAAMSNSHDAGVLDRLFATIQARRNSDPEESYTARLLSQGEAKVAQKVGEEAVETVIEGLRGDSDALASESADLLYHLLVLWGASGGVRAQVSSRLEGRTGSSGLAEQRARSPGSRHWGCLGCSGGSAGRLP